LVAVTLFIFTESRGDPDIMKKQPFLNFSLAGVNLTEFGLEIPSPVCSLELGNSEISTMTSWTLNVIIGSSDTKKANSAAFEALLYSAAQSANGYANSKGIPVSFIFGWLDAKGNIDTYLSYQGFTISYSVSTNGMYLQYKVTGFASLSIANSMPVLRIPAISGFVQPSAVAEALAVSTKATSYYQLDIDHNDAPTLINHGAMSTSFNQYVRGNLSGTDDYETFPGLLRLSKSYSSSRDAAGLKTGYKSLTQVMNNTINTPISEFLQMSQTDTTPQCSSFSYWVDEPTMTAPGIIHYKSNANLQNFESRNTLRYGTADANVISINGTYNGISYNMTNISFKQAGFIVDGSGNSILQDAEVVNSWASTLADVFQTVGIINDVNALATQFSNDFTIQIPGNTSEFKIAQPVSLIVFTGNTLSPITGVYNIISVTHNISNAFITTLKLKRLVMSSANQTAISQGILVSGSSSYSTSSYTTTKNIISPYKVDLGELYPNFEHMGIAL